MAKIKHVISKEDLYEYYIVQNHTIVDCASFFGASTSTIKANINKYDIHKSEENRLERIKQTMLDRYGVEHALQRTESKEKFKNTFNNRSEEQNKVSRQKRIKTCQEKYGADNPLQSEEIKAKVRATNMQRRGCEFAMQSEEVKAKNRETLLRKYGADNASRVEEFKNKRVATIQDKFGVSNYGEVILPQEVRDILNSKEKLIQYIEESGLRTSVDIANKIGCSFSTLNLRINKYQIRNLIDNSKSHYETEISTLLTSWGVLNYKSRMILNSRLEIDFYCPDYNIGIEFNGDYWHNSLNKPKQYHFDKSKDAQSQGIRLIHIWEHEWNDPRKRPIIESMLKIAFGKIENRIYARNCEIREITNAEAKPFNDANHLQGHRNAAVTYGLFYNNQLVQLMSFSKTKYNKNLKGDNSWEIIRGCPGSNNVVVGGVSKLFAHFIREYKPDAVFSYCDFNKFDGKGYEALGMKFIGYTGPDMKWLMPDGSVVDRSPSRHKELKEQAEAQLWGSGSKKYLWQSSNQTINNKTNN